MKISTKETVYVQRNDINYLRQFENMNDYFNIYAKTFTNDINIIDDSNRYEFVRFCDPEDIKYFETIDWILDYKDVKSLNEEELIKLGCSFSDQLNELAKVINNPSTSKSESKKLYEQYQRLQYKMYSLRDFIWYKKGMLDMTFPEGIEVENKKTSQEQTEKIVQEKPKLFSKIFNRLRKNKNDD